MIIVRTLRRDIAKYNRMDEEVRILYSQTIPLYMRSQTIQWIGF